MFIKKSIKNQKKKSKNFDKKIKKNWKIIIKKSKKYQKKKLKNLDKKFKKKFEKYL